MLREKQMFINFFNDPSVTNKKILKYLSASQIYVQTKIYQQRHNKI